MSLLTINHWAYRPLSLSTSGLLSWPPLVLSKTDSNWWKTDCLQTYSLDKIWLFSDIFWGFIAKKLTLVNGRKHKIKPWIETTSNCTIYLGFLALFTMFALEIWLFDKNLTFIWPVWAQKSVNWLFPEKLTTAPAVTYKFSEIFLQLNFVKKTVRFENFPKLTKADYFQLGCIFSNCMCKISRKCLN